MPCISTGATNKVVVPLGGPYGAYTAEVWARPDGLRSGESDKVQLLCKWGADYNDPLRIMMASVGISGALEQGSIYETGSTAADDDGAVHLAWTTESEDGNLGFNVQRSAVADGPYVTVNAGLIPGYGTTGVPREYSFTDASTVSGLSCYRLEQVDDGGAVTYSAPVTVYVPDAAGVHEGFGGVPAGAGAVTYYDVRGVRAVPDAPGVYLVRDADGTWVRRFMGLR